MGIRDLGFRRSKCGEGCGVVADEVESSALEGEVESSALEGEVRWVPRLGLRVAVEEGKMNNENCDFLGIFSFFLFF